MSAIPVTVWDAIHGNIALNELETQIVDSAPFQRLHHIRQLSMSYCVYPSGEHSRFAHSLGVMQFATDMFETLERKHCLKPYAPDEEDIGRAKQILRITALLHDVGHAPFSHASETHDLMPMPHEEFSCRIIRDEYSSLLDDSKLNPYGITASEVCDTLTGESTSRLGPLMHQLISGDLDADRMDYLSRDSHHIGLNCGRFNYPRLVHSLTIPPASDKDEEQGPLLGIEAGGVHAAEEMILARYFMFTQVYFHKTRRALDYHLGNVIRKVLKAEGLEKYPTDTSKYLQCNDARIITWMTNNPGDEDVHKITHRQHMKLFRETFEHADSTELTHFDGCIAKLPEKYTPNLWVDSPEKALHNFEEANFLVIDETTGVPQPIQECSALITLLRPISQRRLYCERDIEQDIIRLWREPQ